ncbi:MAG: GldG family protein [Treponema sp.]|nr:GldG family protein [Treponema sp.]
MTKKQTKIITVLSVIAVILAMLVSSRFWLRLDLTKNKSYTISEVSRNLYRELPDPVSITYFLSDRLKNILPAAGDIEDTIREITAYSRGKITFNVYDPVKTGLVSTINELGLQSRQVQTVEQDQASFMTVYSGIVIEYLDGIDVIPWVISTDTLEYDITSRIRSLLMNTKRVIGVLVADSLKRWSEDFTLLNMLFSGAGYNVRIISPGDEIPDNLPALFVFGGADVLDNWAMYRIDRYIQLGGKVLFAVNSVIVDTIYGTLEAWRAENLGLLDMIASYGVIIRPELTLDRTALNMIYQAGNSQGGYRLARYPLWFNVLSENANAKHPVSVNFSGLDLYWANPLELHPPSSVEAIPLFKSTDSAWLMREQFHTSPEVPYMLELDAETTRGEKILGASLTGTFPSFFRGAEKPVREGSDLQLPDMPLSPDNSRIIVIGDVNFASDVLNATQAMYNLEFILRAADWLTSDDDIISIRSRQPQAGRFDKIPELERRASVMRFSQILNVVLVPLFVIITGLFVASRRKKQSRENAAEKEAPGDL